MCNAVVSSITDHYSSEKIEENNCSDETNPNIIMDSEDIAGVTEIRLENKDITDITGIEEFTYLTLLDLEFNQVSDLSPLANLKHLTRLELSDNQISDLSPLSGLTNLEILFLIQNPINDITPILRSRFHTNDGFIGLNYSSAVANSKVYELPSLFLLYAGTLEIPDDAGPWVEEILPYRELLEWDLQNAVMNEDNKSITITDIDEPSVINIYIDVEGDRMLFAQLTVTYEEPVDPDDPVDPTDEPAVPDTGENTKSADGNVVLNILSCIVPATVMMWFVARYFSRREK